MCVCELKRREKIGNFAISFPPSGRQLEWTEPSEHWAPAIDRFEQYSLIRLQLRRRWMYSKWCGWDRQPNQRYFDRNAKVGKSKTRRSEEMEEIGPQSPCSKYQQVKNDYMVNQMWILRAKLCWLRESNMCGNGVERRTHTHKHIRSTPEAVEYTFQTILNKRRNQIEMLWQLTWTKPTQTQLRND